ncbi:MAG: hypothetical protein ACWA6U_03660 [Breznakibacter sp.]
MKLTAKIAGITMYVLLLISVIFSMLVMVGPLDADASTPSYLNSTLNWSYIMIFGSVALTLVFEIFNIILHPVNAKRTLLSTGGIIALLFIAWSMADATPLQIVGYEGSDNVPSMLKLSDAGLYTFYFMMGLSVIAIIGSEFTRIFK